MGVRTQILSAVFAGLLTASWGVNINTYAAEPPDAPVDEAPGVVVINKIYPAMNEFTVTYTDTGTDVDRAVEFVMAYGAEYGVEIDLGNWPAAYDAENVSILYKKATLEGGLQLVSGQSEVITDADIVFGSSVQMNSNNKIYYGVKTMMEGNADVIRYATGVADYDKCMAYYNNSLECVLEENEYGVMVYQPYENGVKLEVEWERPEEPVSEEPGVGGGEAEEIGENNGEGSGATSDDGGRYQETEGRGESMNFGGNGEWGEAVNLARDYIGGASAYWSVAYNDGALAADDGSNLGEGEVSVKNENANREAANEKKAEMEVPKLGGEEGEDRGGVNWWIVAPVAISVMGIGAWWLYPILKRRKEDE